MSQICGIPCWYFYTLCNHGSEFHQLWKSEGDFWYISPWLLYWQNLLSFHSALPEVLTTIFLLRDRKPQTWGFWRDILKRGCRCQFVCVAAKKKVGGFPTVFNTVLVTTTTNITLSSMTSALSDFWISTNFELATMIPETVPLRWLDWRIKHQSDKTFCHAD